ncbi:hypothetical protein HRbin11_00862 [bacterium HR11]|nr:hypothetical protein HRbin11_00862 [bacterium HR11]
MRTLHVFYRRGAGNAEERMANGQWRMASSEWRTASSQSYPALEPVSSIRGDRDRTLDIRPQTMDHRPPRGPSRSTVCGLWSMVGFMRAFPGTFYEMACRVLYRSASCIPHLASCILHLASCSPFDNRAVRSGEMRFPSGKTMARRSRFFKLVKDDTAIPGGVQMGSTRPGRAVHEDDARMTAGVPGIDARRPTCRPAHLPNAHLPNA